MTTFSQRTFAGGEIAPALYARVDTVKYSTGARQLRNMQVMRHGGAQNRPGTRFVAEVKDSSKAVRLIPFVFNSSQTYVLEFGNLYMRVHQDGAQLTLTSQPVTAITNANPAAVTYTGSDTYANGDEIYISGVVGPIGQYVNGRNFKVVGVNTGTNTFNLTYLDGTAVNSTTWGAYTSGGTIAEVYEISTPYVEADLADIQFVQSADVLTLVHPTYAPRDLIRTGDTSWSLTAKSFTPLTIEPSGLTVTAGAAGANTYKYRVTAVSVTGEESLTGTSVTTASVSAITQASPPVITTTGIHSFFNGEEVVLSGILGMTELNGRRFVVTRITNLTFSLNDTDATTYTAYSSGGTVTGTARAVSCATPTAGAPNAISWTAPLPGPSGDIAYYNIYQARANDGNYGLLGVSTGTSFSDVGGTADTLTPSPQVRNIFDRTGRYPAAVGYYQERLLFAGSDNDPETVFASRSGAYADFRAAIPTQDNDSITFTITGPQVNRVKHVLDLNTLLIFTEAGEHACLAEALTPTDINRKQQSYNGSSTLRPIVIDSDALYVQSLGSIVRSLAFEFQSDGYRGNDLTVFSSHLFQGKTLVDWAYQKVPQSILWAVRSDGTLLGLTYVREQQIVAWHRHDTDGTFENVCAVPEGTETALYCVVNRTINGATKRYIERFDSRYVTEETIKDALFMDAALGYDGRHTGSTTMTLSGGTDWTYDELLTLTASSSSFASTDVGNEVQLTGSDGTLIRFLIVGYTSGTVVTGRPHKTVPVAMRSVAITTWALAVDEVSGLWHLEGQDVAIYGDGFVVASPNNPSNNIVTVTNGKVELERPYAVIAVGLPYLSDLETLDIDTDQAETLTDKKKFVGRVTLTLETSRGIWVGPQPPDDDDDNPIERLYELRSRNTEDYDSPPELRTDNREINIQTQWNSNGRVFIRQIDPVPLTVLSVAPAGIVALKGK